MGKKSRLKKNASGKPKSAAPDNQARCGLCWKTGNLIRTECCGQWVCNDQHKYVLFSYARNSCYRNHARYTLCGYHHNNGHSGDWKDCLDCREAFPTELYVYRGTNEFNFEKLLDPPDFEPTKCIRCGIAIRLGEGGYSIGPEEYKCESCMRQQFPDL